MTMITFKEYLKTQGPNLGNGMWGSMAWQMMKEQEYLRIYGYLYDAQSKPTEPPSQSKPGSFKKLSK